MHDTLKPSSAADGLLEEFTEDQCLQLNLGITQNRKEQVW